jgi:hypothetical protein
LVDVFDSATGNPDEAYLTSFECETSAFAWPATADKTTA